MSLNEQVYLLASIEELVEMSAMLNSIVYSQGELLDSIEDNICTTNQHVLEAEKNIGSYNKITMICLATAGTLGIVYLPVSLGIKCGMSLFGAYYLYKTS